MKNYNNAPLPFQGQKRRFLKEFKKALVQYPEDAIFVDLFGGSGLLSHTIKSVYPNATVIYNDFDGYSERLKNVESTNAILVELQDILAGWPREKRITGKTRDNVLALIEKQKGFVDFITLSSSLLFSMNYVESFDKLQKSTLYNNLKSSPYDAGGYLEGVEIVHLDYQILLKHYVDKKNVVFLADPPYLSTDIQSYHKNYWGLKQFLDVLDVLKNTSYFFFTSNKSVLIELCEWVEAKTGGANPFAGSHKAEIEMKGQNYAYTDIMLYKTVIA